MAKKRTMLSINYTTTRRLKRLMNVIESPVAKSNSSITNYYLYKIAKGEYDNDVKPLPKREKERILVDKEIRDDADEKAKELGFKSASDMLDAVVRLEMQRVNEARKKADKEDDEDDE
ncbi:hypothetical protein [Staphylococcus warneri]|uniref:hypothetical protein n=1 Tax=Staphylococcus warneri TaxID=1292 RepID=UPI000736F9E9|nr:hypothetical protein [Staphylococcus warneri]KTW22864.1 hypothetical protein SA10R_06995 [Staphylococcus warneri]MCJ1788046.1 hypothetical protein [Staphylococcus warneri]MCJ1792953.1 hypothetical protein [Staphylococcus warneri]MCJ1795405.1 hypothetical protein [Staphylococcus warneri]MCJ1797856.1 hypothetical protein [Staphylococcus warneri]